MADYALDLTIHGLTVSGGKVTEVHDGVQEMIQRIVIAIKTHFGEWLLDTTRGLPWSEEILIKNPNLDQIVSRTRAYLLTIEGVIGIRQLDVSVDFETRVMSWALNAETASGVTGPFNVDVTF